MLKKIIILIFISSFFLTSCWNNNKENITKKNNIETEKKQIIENLSVENFEKEMKNSETILIDIRTPTEWKTFWILDKNQKYIIYDNNEKFLKQIKKLDKNKKYLIYCFHWNRTREALKVMKKAWFSYVKDLAWWIDAWILAWKKVEKY
jgi:rhodanese-related sulfurtransferase